jgi:thiosulfate/3-mercaptopyruvate sulfurtransferase
MGVWLMNLYGHVYTRILDCTRDTWRSEGRPWNTDGESPPASSYPLPDEDGQIRVHRSEVERAIGDPSVTIVDVRSASEFRGDSFWPSGGSEPGGRAGHVPTALNVSIEGLHDQGGSFRSVAELREILGPVDLSDDSQLITYCTIGGRASTVWFVLTYLLGRKNVRVYDGSWAEWGRTPTAPVACD